jgi:hypothetical protein
MLTSTGTPALVEIASKPESARVSALAEPAIRTIKTAADTKRMRGLPDLNSISARMREQVLLDAHPSEPSLGA